MIGEVIMLPLLLGAAAVGAFFLSGCSKKEEPAPPPPTNKPETEEQDSPYAKSCFVQPACSDKEKLSAAIDYIGAVYGEKGKYDSVLTPDERKYVKEKFGAISDTKSIASLLSLGQEAYFSKNNLTPYQSDCNQLDWYELIRGSDPMLGEVAALGGRHYCGNEWGLIYLLSGIEADVAADPENWVFFIEDSEKNKFSAPDPNQDNQESELFNRIAERLNIPVFNPLHSLDSEAVIAEMGKKGVSRADYAAAVEVAKVLEMLDYKGVSDPDFQKLSQEQKGQRLHSLLKRYFLHPHQFENELEKVLKTYRVDAESFHGACKKLIEMPDGQNADNHLRKMGKQIANIIILSTETSNKLSTNRSRDILEKTGKKKAFFQMGSAHLPLIMDLYSKTREVDLNAIFELKKTPPR